MREFFRGWRRKAGCVTLMLACFLMQQWMVSFRGERQTVISNNDRAIQRLRFESGTIVWEQFKAEQVLEFEDSFVRVKERSHTFDLHDDTLGSAQLQVVDDGQRSPPDMKLPIQYALTYPERWTGASPRMDWTRPHQLDFFPPDFEAFPALKLGFEVSQRGGMFVYKDHEGDPEPRKFARFRGMSSAVIKWDWRGLGIEHGTFDPLKTPYTVGRKWPDIYVDVWKLPYWSIVLPLTLLSAYLLLSKRRPTIMPKPVPPERENHA